MDLLRAGIRVFEDTSSTSEARAPAVEGSESVFDANTFLDRLMGDIDLAAVVTAGFIDDVPQKLRQLESSLAAGNAPEVEHLGHLLKGAAAAVSGNAMADVAASIEIAGKAGDLDRARAGYLRLQTEFPRLKSTIQAFLASSR